MGIKIIPDARGRCFVMQPFDNGKFDKRYADVFEPAITAAGLEPYRVDRDPGADVLIEQIEKGIADSVACFAEITTDNPNVWYELGFAMASSKPFCMVCSAERQTPFPFDVRHRSIIKYEVGSTSDFNALGERITARLKGAIMRQGQADTLFSLKPTMANQGVTPHEVAAMALIMAQFDGGGVGAWQLKEDMRRAGYTDIATGIAIEKLRRSAFIESRKVEDERGDAYTLWCLTTKGTEWLITNENKLALKADKGTPPGQDDIPF